MKPLIIFKVGSTFEHLAAEIGDFEQWIIQGLGFPPITTAIVDPRRNELLPDPNSIAGAIITGSHSMVSDREPWSEALADWIVTATANNVPLLGICYGHQLLAHALGGIVDYHPSGLEIGTVAIELTPHAANDPLFKDLPLHFPAHATHRQTVIKLPKNAVLLAKNAFEPHHAFRIGENAWGVQFHPEFNEAAMRCYIQYRCEDWQKIAALLDQVVETSESAQLLKKFAEVLSVASQPN